MQELKEIQAYFKIEKRNPTDVELQTIAKLGANTVAIKPSKVKSSSTAKKSTASSKPT